MQDSPTSVTAPHASLRHKKNEMDEGGVQWGGCHDARLTQAPRPSYEMWLHASPSRDMLWGLQSSPSQTQLKAPRFRTDRWGDQTPLSPHQATIPASRPDQTVGGQRPAFVEKFAAPPPVPSHAYCANDLPRQVRRPGHPTPCHRAPPLATTPHPMPPHPAPCPSAPHLCSVATASRARSRPSAAAAARQRGRQHLPPAGPRHLHRAALVRRSTASPHGGEPGATDAQERRGRRRQP